MREEEDREVNHHASVRNVGEAAEDTNVQKDGSWVTTKRPKTKDLVSRQEDVQVCCNNNHGK